MQVSDRGESDCRCSESKSAKKSRFPHNFYDRPGIFLLLTASPAQKQPALKVGVVANAAPPTATTAAPTTVCTQLRTTYGTLAFILVMARRRDIAMAARSSGEIGGATNACTAALSFSAEPTPSSQRSAGEGGGVSTSCLLLLGVAREEAEAYGVHLSWSVSSCVSFRRAASGRPPEPPGSIRSSSIGDPASRSLRWQRLYACAITLCSAKNTCVLMLTNAALSGGIIAESLL